MPANLPNFAKVNDTLYRGGQPTPEGFHELQKMGIKTVVTLRFFKTDKKITRALGLKHLHLPFKQIYPEDEDVIEFLEVVLDPPNQPVFVHCRNGTDRTGMVVAIYRMVLEDWPKQKAIEEMKEIAGIDVISKPFEDYVENLDVAALKAKIQGAGPLKIDVAP